MLVKDDVKLPETPTNRFDFPARTVQQGGGRMGRQRSQKKERERTRNLFLWRGGVMKVTERSLQ